MKKIAFVLVASALALSACGSADTGNTTSSNSTVVTDLGNGTVVENTATVNQTGDTE
jgi:uncharacterized protein YcfL